VKRAALVIAVLAAGCGEVTLSALTVAPPGKTAHLDNEAEAIHLSRGIAIGFECTANEDDYHGPCRKAKIYVDNPDIVAGYTSFMDTTLDSYEGGYEGARQRSAFIIVGLQPGTTDVTIDTDDGNVTLDVTIQDD
jgi:hypothetical protein